jgi:hypothetical protein
MAFTAFPPQPFQWATSRRSPAGTRRRLVAAGALLAAAGAGGYAVAQVPGRSGTPAVTPASQLALTDRVLAPSSLPGFIVTRPAQAIRTASQWAVATGSRTPTREAARLRGLGFVGGVDEQLHGRSPLASEAVSLVEQYRTAAGARAELVYESAQLRGPGTSTFAVPGVPGAVGLEVKGRGNEGVNVLFSAGRYFYVVGAGFPSSGRAAVSTNQLSAAAGALYLTVNGCVAGSGTRA